MDLGKRGGDDTSIQDTKLEGEHPIEFDNYRKFMDYVVEKYSQQYNDFKKIDKENRLRGFLINYPAHYGDINELLREFTADEIMDAFDNGDEWAMEAFDKAWTIIEAFNGREFDDDVILYRAFGRRILDYNEGDTYRDPGLISTAATRLGADEADWTVKGGGSVIFKITAPAGTEAIIRQAVINPQSMVNKFEDSHSEQEVILNGLKMVITKMDRDNDVFEGVAIPTDWKRFELSKD